jgi:hypothetical protein
MSELKTINFDEIDLLFGENLLIIQLFPRRPCSGGFYQHQLLLVKQREKASTAVIKCIIYQLFSRETFCFYYHVMLGLIS